MHVPTTSRTLLRDIGADADSPRWAEFVARYRPVLEAFLAAKFPSLAGEADDLLQETFLAVVRVLPSYRYVPGEKGAFRNYLAGILRNKALMRLRSRAAEVGRARRAAEDAAARPCGGGTAAADPDDAAWREAAFEIALRQLLADDAIQERTKQVFVRVAVKGEAPADVARDFGISRNAADQMRSRMVRRLRELVSALENDAGV